MARVVVIRDIKRRVVTLKGDERGGYRFVVEGEEGTNFLPLGLMIWGATDQSTVTRIVCADRLCMMNDTPLPARFFGTAQSFEELLKLWEEEATARCAEGEPPPPAEDVSPPVHGMTRRARVAARPHLAPPSWLDFYMMSVGQSFEVETRGPITAVALLGKRYTVVKDR
jgi:hypothetical protein